MVQIKTPTGTITARSVYVRSQPIPDDPKQGSIDFRLTKTRFMREQRCPVRELSAGDLQFEFEAPDWDEIFPYNFRGERGFQEPDVELQPEPGLKPDHSFGPNYRVVNGGLSLQVKLPAMLQSYVAACCDPQSDEYVLVKFDLLAKCASGWFHVDPQLGVRP